MTIKVIHYPATNSVEVTWTIAITPAQFIPEQHIAEVQDADGNMLTEAQVIPAYTIPAVEQSVRCHSYADVQMDELEADLGADAADYASLIAAVKANIKPPAPPTAEQIAAALEAKKAELRAVREGILNRLSGIATNAMLTGDTATTAAYVVVRQGLLDITKDLPADDSVDGVVIGRYGALVAACTPQMVSAFAKVDA